MTSLAISGFCPMGCGWTLRIDEDGDVGCVNVACPRPTAVANYRANVQSNKLDGLLGMPVIPPRAAA